VTFCTLTSWPRPCTRRQRTSIFLFLLVLCVSRKVQLQCMLLDWPRNAHYHAVMLVDLSNFVHVTNSGFAEMVMYIEACESGSIFEGILDDSLKIYAVVSEPA
jgi:Peptidase C13 family